MRQLYFQGIRAISDQKGNILFLTSFVILGLFMMTIGFIELGRFLIIREQVQTINDAVVLAGVGAKDSAQKWVNIDVHTQHGSFKECSTDSDGVTTCWCNDCGHTVIEGVPGLESDLLDNGGWRKYTMYNCGGCDTPYETWYTFNDREIIYNMSDMLSQINSLKSSAGEARQSVNRCPSVGASLQTIKPSLSLVCYRRHFLPGFGPKGYFFSGLKRSYCVWRYDSI